jgi:hypothetical protein
VGEMAGRPEGGAKGAAYSGQLFPKTRLKIVSTCFV